MIEIERKFLVKSDAFKAEAYKHTKIVQGFLNTHKARTVRVRVKGNEGFLTVKGQSTKDGLERFEWEKAIEKSDAEALLKLCEDGVIDKIRYEIKMNQHVFEVDEFFGDNAGLIVAEIELSHPTEIISKPLWLGKEVTGEVRYYNSQLSKQPYKTWK
ncbi:adenylate cyclase [Formosa agariphila KMM 3901]|uniref:Adenylate cyclase n=1 Tax=Formosa agariphila (strain DSM 15362 / KCTC 12365 / LMG 23005 / KMM 3901 / M-2Alg 35-1) TaxID=1347342 RepID=T2KQJ4_FORAG|nr:CYTH domain-containing protein [Formosa agariphila]CDF81107.1 adenylate cyclase [Formosa agariphila KMM 3901]